MIAFDFEYFKPETVDETIHTYRQLQLQRKRSIYIAGGTEFISRARLGQVHADAVIDLKGIPECNVLEVQGGQAVIGSAIRLTQLEEAGLFPLLGTHSRKIADHTSRNRITLGGNIAGETVYRELVLPLLISDCEVIVAKKSGLEATSIHDIFNQHLLLQDGEFIVQFRVSVADTTLPFISVKKTAFSSFDYPLVSIAAIRKEERTLIALGGVCGYPFRSREIEESLNNQSLSIPDRIHNAIGHLPAPMLDDFRALRDYREFVLKHALNEVLHTLEGGPEI